MQPGDKDDSEQRPGIADNRPQDVRATLRSSTPGSATIARPLRPLLPRQIPTDASSSLSIRLAKPSSRQVYQKPRGACGVPRCPRLPCELVSHRQYAKWLRQSILSRNSTSSNLQMLHIGSASLQSRSSSQFSGKTTPAPEPQFDVLPDLPFETPYPNEFREIFHFFMTTLLDRLLLIFRPPLKVEAYKKDLLEHLLSSELFATVCLANGKFEMIMRNGRRSTESDPVATVIYSQITKMIYHRLNDLQDPDIDALLMCVGALANFDSLTLKKQVLAGHQRATEQLVAARGGVHNLGRSLPYVIQSDLILSVVTGNYPAFSKPNRDLLPLLRKQPDHYGAMLRNQQLSAQLEPEVIVFCQETCHVIDLFERAKISYDLHKPSQGDPQLRPYFFFSRHQLGSEFAHMHAKYLQEKGRNWCMLVAAKLVEYPVVHGNYTLMFTEHLVRELSQALQEQDLAQEWHHAGRAFVWVLWTIVTAPVPLDLRSWAHETLFESVKRRYSSHSPGLIAKWAIKEWELCMHFVWSQEHLKAAFDAVTTKWNAATDVG